MSVSASPLTSAALVGGASEKGGEGEGEEDMRQPSVEGLSSPSNPAFSASAASCTAAAVKQGTQEILRQDTHLFEVQILESLQTGSTA